MRKIGILFSLLFPLAVFARTNDIRYWEHRLTFAPLLDVNRTLPDRLIFPLKYRLSYRKSLFLETGVSFNLSSTKINGWFVRPGYENIAGLPIGFSLKFLGDQYLEYNRSVNSIIPSVYGEYIWNRYRLFAEYGVNFRFLVTDTGNLMNIFYYPETSREAEHYYRVALSLFFLDGKYRITLEGNNCSDFYAGNHGHYGFFLEHSYQLDNRFRVWVTPGFRQAGSIALAASYYQFILILGGEMRL